VHNSRDRELGMHRKITRRDFLNGVAVTAGASMLPRQVFGADSADPQKSPAYYPPALTGLRGSHVGSFETAHSLRDGTFWDSAGKPEDTGESYDLIVVGGGISGLAAAHFYRNAMGAKARILILENHDDFGGHAKRNELRAGQRGSAERTMIGYGGTYSIESPEPYSAVSKGLIEELGIDVSSFPKYLERSVYSSAGRVPKIFFDKETFGIDKLVDDPYPFPGGETYNLAVAAPDAWEHFMAEAPIAEQARKDISRLCREKTDYLPRLNQQQKEDRLSRISYAQFLTEVAGVDPDVVRLYQTISQPLFSVGIEAVSAQDACESGYPGFSGMGLDTSALDVETTYFFHFPDGNASIARLLVRKLIPDALPGNSATDVVTSRANYAKLDDAASPVRIRLNSTVVRVKHIGDVSSAKEVEISYARYGKVYTARAKNTVLACWHVIIPFMCEELPDKQKEALSSAQKAPLVYSNVLLRNSTAFQKVGANAVYAPGGYHTLVDMDIPVSIGGYQCSRTPEEPAVVHMSKSPCHAGLTIREQNTAGRIELYTTEFETIERNIREQLARILGPGGFDPARDIDAITVNRWPHGYAYEYSTLFDKFLLEGGTPPCEIARKPYGRIAIANSDAGAHAYTNCAIDQAYRAVGEITKSA
jgi:spermidine dehydrogenase